MIPAQLSFVAEVTGATRAERGRRIQYLWAGYGELFRVHLEGGPRATAVVKWVKPPGNLWKVGTYWHLDTRRDELAATKNAALIARANMLDRTLSLAKHQTIVHGDAKPASFCFAIDGASVAAVDFQYAGGGPGIKDLAYLLHGVDRPVERQAVEQYFAALRDALPANVDANDVEREWRALYPAAVEDFERFLAGWRGLSAMRHEFRCRCAGA